MVSPDLDGVTSTFEVMAPLFERVSDGQHLRIVDLVVLLDWQE